MEFLKKWKRITKIEELHGKLFEQTSSYQYYLLGFANAFAGLYNILNDMPETEWLQEMIVYSVSRDESVKKYFDDLIDTSERPNEPDIDLK